MPHSERAGRSRSTAGAAGDADALKTLLERARVEPSYAALRNLVRSRRRLAATDAATPALRIALAGNGTTTYLAPALSLLVEARGVVPALYELPYGSLESELLQADSVLAGFRPQMLILVDTPLAITGWPDDTADAETGAAFAEERVARMLAICRAAHDRFGCDVILDNLHALPARPHGSGALRMPAERNALIVRMNTLLAESAPDWLRIHDVAGIAALEGLRRWVDWRFWYHARQPLAFDVVSVYVSSLSSVIAALIRPGIKCVVVDLDNTLWGGVIGDAGLAGIRVRPGDAEGEAFLAFQRHLLRLKQRGLVLAVCSKNEPDTARAPFLELPDMVLKLDDFVCFKASWDTKPDGLRAIATELNLGLDALAFVDDNPAEREHVRAALPDVRVVDLPDDPADFPAALERTGWFEAGAVSAEDRERTRQYQANVQRSAASATIGNYAEYLATLQQRAVIREFQPAQVQRITQLINKTNQFNLTTRRVTAGEVEDLLGRHDVVTAGVRLSDRFGDNGLIAVLYGRIDAGVLTIEQWLMSCRVFHRGVEQLLMNYVVEAARARGVRHIIGEYRPTAKNGLVRDLYGRLSFHLLRAAADLDGELWQLDVDGYQPLDHTITLQLEQPA